MHCFASENQILAGTVIFGVESLKSLKGQENLLLKNLPLKTRVENVWFLSWRTLFVGKYGIQSTDEMAFERTVTLREFLISCHQIWCAHAIAVQRIYACARKMPPCRLPLTGWYGYSHALGTGQALGWCMCPPCFKFVTWLLDFLGCIDDEILIPILTAVSQ